MLDKSQLHIIRILSQKLCCLCYFFSVFFLCFCVEFEILLHFFFPETRAKHRKQQEKWSFEQMSNTTWRNRVKINYGSELQIIILKTTVNKLIDLGLVAMSTLTLKIADRISKNYGQLFLATLMKFKILKWFFMGIKRGSDPFVINASLLVENRSKDNLGGRTSF
jgi:hypothetical protein